jgi:hypothetical protein
VGAAITALAPIYAPLASPTFTGDPKAPTPATADNDTSIATTAFVKAAISAGPPAGALINDVAPAAPVGTLWWDSVAGQLYVRYDDGNTQQWVTAANMQGLANAATKADVAPAFNAIGRNLIHNPLFNVAQRGGGPWTAQSAFTADRFQIYPIGSTHTITIVTLADGDRTAIGDEAARYCLQGVCVGTAGATDQAVIFHRMEDIRRIAGKNVTLSFWAKATAGAPKLGLGLTQFFGAGGSPSASVAGIGAQAFTLSTVWARYTATIAIPSTAGKTFGTTIGTDFFEVAFMQSAGATNGPNYGSPGVQSYTLQLWGVQLEIGSQATPLEKPDPRYDLANCQRFYQIGYFNYGGYGAAGTPISVSQQLPVTMRVAPTMVNTGGGAATNVSSPVLGIGNGSNSGFYIGGNVTGVGNFAFYGNYSASADL